MLGMPIYAPAEGDSAPLDYSFTAGSPSRSANTSNFSETLAFGATAADRFLVVAVSSMNIGSTALVSMSSATIGGVAATIFDQRAVSASSGSSAFSAVIGALVPAGTSGAVACSFNRNCYTAVGVNRLTGLQSTTPTDTGFFTGQAYRRTALLDVEDGGVIVAANAHFANSIAFWETLTRRSGDSSSLYDWSNGSDVIAAGQADFAVSVRRNDGNTGLATGGVLIAASFR